MESNKVAIIIPAFNEESSIGYVVSELFDVLGRAVDIIVVNDCSSDRTAFVAKNAGAFVIDLQVNLGYAKAINKGFEYASLKQNIEYILTMDGDGQHDPYSVEKFIDYVKQNNVDLVVGVREKKARFSEWLFCRYFYKKFKVLDPLCGLKLYNKKIYVEYGTFETYDSIGTELLVWALLTGCVIKQLPVKIRNRNGSSRFGSFWSANKRILLSIASTMNYLKINDRA